MFIEINSIYDFISLFSLLINIYFIFSFDIILIMGLVICVVAHLILKRITTGWNPAIFKRPDGASNCNLFNKGGLVDKKSGFPSGHITVVSFFMETLLLRYNSSGLLNKLYFNIPTILVGYSRIKKGCHNLIQVIAGYLLGYLVAYTLHNNEPYINKYINHYIDNYMKDYFSSLLI
jgi:membrane-associated phospholipid phosphatase